VARGSRMRPRNGGFRSLEGEDEGGKRRDARPPGVGGPLPHESSIPLASALFFSWYDPLLKLGQSRSLEQDDIWTVQILKSQSSIVALQ
jgi:hypothetical protein